MAKTKTAGSEALGSKVITEIRDTLLEQRQEILDLYEHDLREGQRASDEGSEDIVDRANSSYNREFMFSLSGTERDTLFQIEAALGRISNGGFGSCANCLIEIPVARLRAVPWAKHCLSCQELEEKGLLQEN